MDLIIIVMTTAAAAAAPKTEIVSRSGKDTVIIASKENHSKPSSIKLVPRPDDREPGPILPNGEINWACPCLGSMASGPCAVEFREAFSCFHYSKAEPKGNDNGSIDYLIVSTSIG